MSKFPNKKFLYTYLNPMSEIAEKYRNLRNNIEYSTAAQGMKTILVTSALPQEGKTVTAINLATAYAYADKKVLLIEGDLRKPVLQQVFSIQSRLGLTNVLRGECPASEAINATSIDNLSVMVAGNGKVFPSDALASREMTALMSRLRSQFDVIIVDSTAVLGVTDAHLLAKQCDGTLLVIQAGKLPRDTGLKAKAVLERLQVRIIGAVLNNDRSSKGKYSSYYTGKDKENA
jgi:capsular exopolysaccharide synthesis family protein